MKKALFFISIFSVISLSAIEKATVFTGVKASEKVSNSEIVRLKSFTNVPNYVKFRKGKGIPLEKLEGWLNQFYKSDAKYGIQLIKKEVGKLGLSHYRYQQTVNGVPVELSAFIAHVQNGLVVSVNGELFSNVNAPSTASLSEAVALGKALNHIGATTYKWQIQAEEDHLKWEQEDVNATYYPTGELVLVNDKGQVEKSLQLAYKFNVYAQEPFSRREIFVDATSGEIVWEQNMIHEADVTGSATTLYSGTQTIVCDNSSGPFRLRETGRGNGIRTFTNGNSTNYTNTDITNGSAIWTVTDAGIDAHWGAEMTYDYYLNVHGRNSIDGAGFRLDSYVHHDDNYANAFWDGNRMTYGDGAGNSAPLTSIDVAGHEVTHGLTTNTADLVYQDESGALNESFSDIFGISIDMLNRPGHPNANWVLGDDLGMVIRNMADPNSEGDPHTYFGNNWQPLGGADNGGVHSNSGVQNFWFVLLTDGGAGTNDNGDAYTVNSIGITVAGQVAFRNLTIYLTQSSDYADARFYGIQSAIDLFGACTSQVQEVTNAWYAVGVGPMYAPFTVSDFDVPIDSSCIAPFTVDFNNLSVNGISYSWDFGDFNSSTQTNPSHTYNNYGIYTVELIADGGASCGVDTTVKIAYIVIDSLLPCISTLPTSGTASTQTSCEGTLYDSGGPTANYGAEEDAQITIAPIGASIIDLTFVSFDVEAGQNGSCNFDYVRVYDGPNTSSPLIDTYCNNNVPTTVSSTGGAITIVFHSDQGTEDAGFQIDWQCQLPNQAPSVDFSVDVDTTCTGIVNFTDLSSNGPTSWVWDFGDTNGSTQQNPSHTYSSNGLYTVELTADNGIGSGNLIKTAFVFVNMPAAPSITGDVICENNTANLSASGSGILNWYAAATGGSPVNTGTSYTTPSLNITTTYYVEDVIVAPNQAMGKPDNTGGGNNFNNSQYLIFDVYQSMEIVSVVVYSGGAGNRTIELRNSSGTVLQSATVNIPNGTQTVALNFNVTPGTDYQLGVSNSSMIDMYRNNGGTAYPYTLNGIASITKSSAGTNPVGYYYFFYDWKVKEMDCVSSRTTVTATVNALPTVVANTTDTAICSGDPVTLTGSGANTYLWNNGVVDGTPFNPTVTNTYTVTGTDANNCSNQDQITVVVNTCTGINALNEQTQVTSFLNGANSLQLEMTNLNGNYNLVVLNALGQVLVSEKINVSSKQQREIINLNTIAKGLYYINLYNEHDNYTMKLVK
ncbi:MAG: hypothetical protein COB15_16025 [Flavobacteriales bacterium]|nr:MAG: hypothetical protein COB15_16025 [Flavobacteriales bacterium]